MNVFEQFLTPQEHKLLADLDSPTQLQAFLDSIPYVGEDLNRSPLRVLRDRQAHCLDGGLFAALALRRLGHPPIIMDLIPAPGTDDDHVLAVFKKNGLYGAVAKSNFVGLRYREPIYRSLRELVMSYFEFFYNIEGEKTMRAYTRPLNLQAFDRYQWMWSEEGVEIVVKHFYARHGIFVIDEQSCAGLSRMDPRTYEAGMLGVNYDGLFKPGNPH